MNKHRLFMVTLLTAAVPLVFISLLLADCAEKGPVNPEDKILWDFLTEYPNWTNNYGTPQMHVTAPGDLWVGLTTNQEQPVFIAHYVGGSWVKWSKAPVGHYAELLDPMCHGIYAETAQKIWVAIDTEFSDYENGIYVYDGAQWVQKLEVYSGMGGMDFWDNTHGVAVSLTNDDPDDAGVYTYDGATWTYWPCECYGSEVAMASATVAFVAGGPPGVIYRFEAGNVTSYELPVAEINDLEMLSPDLGWACCGFDGVYHFDGAAWTLMPSFPGVTADTCCFLNPNFGFISGRANNGEGSTAGCVYRFEKGTFYPERVEGGFQSERVAAASETSAYVAEFNCLLKRTP